MARHVRIPSFGLRSPGRSFVCRWKQKRCRNSILGYARGFCLGSHLGSLRREAGPVLSQACLLPLLVSRGFLLRRLRGHRLLELLAVRVVRVAVQLGLRLRGFLRVVPVLRPVALSHRLPSLSPVDEVWVAEMRGLRGFDFSPEASRVEASVFRFARGPRLI